jgi:iron complex outermembrane recepter protein
MALAAASSTASAAAALTATVAASFIATPAMAQEAPAATTRLDTITVTGRAEPVPAIGGWGEVPLDKLPFQASVFSAETLRERGAQRLSDITRLDPSVSDAYNTEGYWDYLTVRGFVIDNRFNYRRDGLPINAETSIPLENKERIEVLKGTSGLQAGTSAPGGLVNLIVKRPLETPQRSATLAWRERGSVLGAVDLSQRFGTDRAFGLRLNAAAETLDPKVRNAEGRRHLLALAGDWRIGSGTLVEAEFETSHRSQPSVPGFSMLGSLVPSPVDPRINLNNQPWSQPVVLDADTASLRLTQRLSGDWKATAHFATQRLRSDDRIAFPFGCYDAGTDIYYADRYCPDGRYDLADFRSENERRRTDAAELALSGQLVTGAMRHTVSAGLQYSKVKNRFQQQAYNSVGQGNVQGTLVTPADPALTDENTNRDERSTEFFLRDALALTPELTAWLGLRHTRLERDSVRTNGSRATSYTQSITTPSAALSYAVSPQTTAYISWGRGTESEVAPNRARYTNRGEALPALRSRQVEAGLKGNTALGGSELSWGLALFDIERPTFADIGIKCDSDTPGNTCTRRADGVARHRGLEAQAGWRDGPWTLQAGAQWLQARRQGSVDASINGKRPTNVPASTLKLQTRYDIAAVPGLALRADLVAESDRMLLPDNSARIPGQARLDLGLRYHQGLANGSLLWRVGIDNALDRRAWREAPYQFGHVYLFPQAPRTVRVSVEASM